MITLNDSAYRELRCPTCHKLICYEYIYAGRVAIVCPRCGEIKEFIFKHMETKEIKDIIDTQFNMKGGDK